MIAVSLKRDSLTRKMKIEISLWISLLLSVSLVSSDSEHISKNLENSELKISDEASDDCEQPCLINLKVTRPSLQENFLKSSVHTYSSASNSNVKCVDSKYRTINGSCNNLKQPNWGTVNSKYTRILPANYADGVHKPRLSVSNTPLPLARLISTTIYPDIPIPDPKWTLLTMSWGQFISHDMSLALGVNQITGENPVCCGSGSQPLSPACLPMIIPENDPFYAQFNQTCLNFIRSGTDLDTKQNPGNTPAEQILGVTPWLDASVIYGSTDDLATNLRSFSGGKLKVEVRNKKTFPPAAPNKTTTCFISKPEEACYLFGDGRGDQNPQIALIQILMLREHNRIADELAKVNPQWNDETLYQESRRIVTAIFQHISYYEWMPIILGKKALLRNKLIYYTRGYVNDYDQKADPSVINSHATAAYRFFHSSIQGLLQLVKEMRIVSGVKRLSDYYVKPSILEEGNSFDEFARGLTTQGQQKLDEYHTGEQTNLLFKFGQPFGSDLKATDIQRERDHGLATYNEFRQLCGFPKAKNFSDFADLIETEKITKLAALFESPDDVDLTIGGSLEKNLPGTLVGPVFSCILLEQFYRTRVADRYFYEAGGQTGSFTLEQLNEIRKVTYARITCDNSDNVRMMQPRAFEKLSLWNSLAFCNNYDVIPAMNLKKWKE